MCIGPSKEKHFYKRIFIREEALLVFPETTVEEQAVIDVLASAERAGI
jgi:hypothetical protein